MDPRKLSWFVFFAIFCANAVYKANAATIVTGTVFCDQCIDGHLSLFDYPLSGVKVAVACPGADQQGTIVGEETTNWFGSYSIKFDGTPDLSSCFVQVTGSNGDTHNCTASAGPAQKLRPLFKWFAYAFYSVDSLLSQPPQPMSFCPRATSPAPPAPVPTTGPITPVAPPSPPTSSPVYTLPPAFGLPPMPPMPFSEASACQSQSRIMEENRCYWRAVNPETKVAVLFGPLAAERYGTDLTMWQSLQGRDDPYHTLLREGTTAYLNSFNSPQFPYNTVAVVEHMNSALAGSENLVLLTALRFMRANSGYNGKSPCRFTPCK